MTYHPSIRILLLFAAACPIQTSAPAQACAPPVGFIGHAPPAIANADQLVAHTEQIVVDRPLAVVLDAGQKKLKDTIKKTSSLPGVAGDYPLNSIPFGTPGARRLVCPTPTAQLSKSRCWNRPAPPPPPTFTMSSGTTPAALPNPSNMAWASSMTCRPMPLTQGLSGPLSDAG